MPKKTPDDILTDIKTRPTVPVWPHVGWLYSVGKNKAYEMAQEGLSQKTGEYLRSGRTIRATTSPLRKQLGIEA